VLFWGILGVVVLRAIMIGVGAALVQHFAWVLYIFGAFLLFTGVKMALSKDDSHPDLANNPVLRFVRRHMRVTEQIHGPRFFVRLTPPGNQALRYATPLFLALVLIELADLVFAVDSVPAIFAITQDPFIVYTSNIFAILGLRSLYFALAALMHFVYLKYAGDGADLHRLQDLLARAGGQGAGGVSLGVTFGLLLGGAAVAAQDPPTVAKAAPMGRPPKRRRVRTHSARGHQRDCASW
jgi:tellurite resistance protein TerC